jgi:hypothetical protein
MPVTDTTTYTNIRKMTPEGKGPHCANSGSDFKTKIRVTIQPEYLKKSNYTGGGSLPLAPARAARKRA